MTNLTKGILQRNNRGMGKLFDPARPEDSVFVPTRLVREHDLPHGATVSGPLCEGGQGPELAEVASVCGLAPDAFRQRPPFERLVAIDPDQRFQLDASGELAMRLVDLAAPIGRGTRGLIVSPPKAGKTMLLEQLAHAIQADTPQTRILILLIDERPEEVTHFRRAVEAQVFASSSDRPLREHIALAELMMAHIRVELECGHDIVVLMDSLTRLARTFNLRGSGARRTLSGGLDAAAMEIPRRFFGLARNIENGGSVTILATVLVDTGSRLDQMIFEEFKGTGNSEIVLSRELAEARIFPALDLVASGTRKYERLYEPEQVERLDRLYRVMANRKPKEALLSLIELVERYPTNREFLANIPPRAKLV